MLLKEGETDLLPCAGITLIRFTGIISADLFRIEDQQVSTPGTLKLTKLGDVRTDCK